jgi:hypothetical protein
MLKMSADITIRDKTNITILRCYSLHRTINCAAVKAARLLKQAEEHVIPSLTGNPENKVLSKVEFLDSRFRENDI